MQKIKNDLDAVNKLLSKYNNISELPNIEHDIVLAKLREVYDLVRENSEKKAALQYADNESVKKSVVSASVIEIAAKPVAEIKEKEEVIVPKKESEEILSLDIDDVKPVEKAEEISHKVEPESKSAKVEHESFTEKTIIAEKYQKNHTLINELLAQGLQKKDISSLMQSKPVKDIEAAIGINEQFVFIKELFSGDGETYLKTIRILNNAANFNEAFNYIRQTYSWNLDSEAAKSLLEIVRRRFIIDVE